MNPNNSRSYFSHDSYHSVDDPHGHLQLPWKTQIAVQRYLCLLSKQQRVVDSVEFQAFITKIKSTHTTYQKYLKGDTQLIYVFVSFSQASDAYWVLLFLRTTNDTKIGVVEIRELGRGEFVKTAELEHLVFVHWNAYISVLIHQSSQNLCRHEWTRNNLAPAWTSDVRKQWFQEQLYHMIYYAKRNLLS